MKIVIAGASGLIGDHLTGVLLQSGHHVTALTTRAIERAASENPAFVKVHWDGASAGEWSRYVDGADAIVNLSGRSLASGRWTRARKQDLIRSRLASTESIVAAICSAKRKPSVFINASAVGYYGHIESGDVTEDHLPGTDFLAALCAQWERAAMAAASSGVRVVLIRSGVVLDSRGGALQRMVLPFRFFAGGTLGDGTQWIPWIHREDEARAIIFAIENANISGPVNLAAPDAVTMAEFCRTLSRVLRRPSFMTIPAFVLRALLGEMAQVVLTGQRAVPGKLLQAGFRFQHPTLQEALSNLLRPPSSAH